MSGKGSALLMASLFLSGCYEDQMRKEMSLLGCGFSHNETLPEKRYCGKACFKNVVREHYICSDGSRTFFDH